MAGLTREEQLERQRQYVEAHKGCNHIIACAITDEDKTRALTLVRQGNPVDAAIGMSALTGPCLRKEAS